MKQLISCKTLIGKNRDVSTHNQAELVSYLTEVLYLCQDLDSILLIELNQYLEDQKKTSFKNLVCHLLSYCQNTELVTVSLQILVLLQWFQGLTLLAQAQIICNLKQLDVTNGLCLHVSRDSSLSLSFQAGIVYLLCCGIEPPAIQQSMISRLNTMVQQPVLWAFSLDNLGGFQVYCEEHHQHLAQNIKICSYSQVFLLILLSSMILPSLKSDQKNHWMQILFDIFEVNNVAFGLSHLSNSCLEGFYQDKNIKKHFTNIQVQFSVQIEQQCIITCEQLSGNYQKQIEALCLFFDKFDTFQALYKYYEFLNVNFPVELFIQDSDIVLKVLIEASHNYGNFELYFNMLLKFLQSISTLIIKNPILSSKSLQWLPQLKNITLMVLQSNDDYLKISLIQNLINWLDLDFIFQNLSIFFKDYSTLNDQLFKNLLVDIVSQLTSADFAKDYFSLLFKFLLDNQKLIDNNIKLFQILQNRFAEDTFDRFFYNTINPCFKVLCMSIADDSKIFAQLENQQVQIDFNQITISRALQILNNVHIFSLLILQFVHTRSTNYFQPPNQCIKLFEQMLCEIVGICQQIQFSIIKERMFSKLRLTINIDNLKADKMINQLKQCFTEIYDLLQCVAFIYQQLGLTDFLEIKKLCDLVRFQFTELFDQVNSPCEKWESLCALNEQAAVSVLDNNKILKISNLNPLVLMQNGYLYLFSYFFDIYFMYPLSSWKYLFKLSKGTNSDSVAQQILFTINRVIQNETCYTNKNDFTKIVNYFKYLNLNMSRSNKNIILTTSILLQLTALCQYNEKNDFVCALKKFIENAISDSNQFSWIKIRILQALDSVNPQQLVPESGFILIDCSKPFKHSVNDVINHNIRCLDLIDSQQQVVRQQSSVANVDFYSNLSELKLLFPFCQVMIKNNCSDQLFSFINFLQKSLNTNCFNSNILCNDVFQQLINNVYQSFSQFLLAFGIRNLNDKHLIIQTQKQILFATVLLRYFQNQNKHHFLLLFSLFQLFAPIELEGVNICRSLCVIYNNSNINNLSNISHLIIELYRRSSTKWKYLQLTVINKICSSFDLDQFND